MQGSHVAVLRHRFRSQRGGGLQLQVSTPPFLYHANTTTRLPFFCRQYKNQLMFSRFSQLARHLSRPQPNYAHTSAAAFASSAARVMTSPSTADERNTRTIHTAACLIIGDEVLGGKVRLLRTVLRDIASSQSWWLTCNCF
jgi:hypothetical protein